MQRTKQRAAVFSDDAAVCATEPHSTSGSEDWWIRFETLRRNAENPELWQETDGPGAPPPNDGPCHSDDDRAAHAGAYRTIADRVVKWAADTVASDVSTSSGNL